MWKEEKRLCNKTAHALKPHKKRVNYDCEQQWTIQRHTRGQKKYEQSLSYPYFIEYIYHMRTLKAKQQILRCAGWQTQLYTAINTCTHTCRTCVRLFARLARVDLARSLSLLFRPLAIVCFLEFVWCCGHTRRVLIRIICTRNRTVTACVCVYFPLLVSACLWMSRWPLWDT